MTTRKLSNNNQMEENSQSEMALDEKSNKADHSMKIYSDMYARGKRRAIESGAIEKNEDDIEALTEQVKAAASETSDGPYDPKNNPQDKIRETEYQKNCTDRKEAEQGLKHAAVKVREKESALAKIRGIQEIPIVSPLIFIGAISMIGLSLMPTNHDIFFSVFEDQILSWGLSLLCGVVAGLFVSWSILGSVEATGEKTALNWGGLLGGMTLVVGFAILRLSEADSNSQYILCLALTLIEVGAIILLEFVAHGLRVKNKEWSYHLEILQNAEAELQAAIQDHNRWNNIVNKNETEIKAHLRYVEGKSIRHMNVDRLIENAIKSIKDGYYDGIAYNRGTVFGKIGKGE